MSKTAYSSDSWDGYAATTKAAPKSTRFAKTGDSALSPLNFTVRESRDSDLSPNSRAIIIACDDTGSMGDLAHELITNGIGKVFGEIIDRKCGGDPQVMGMVFGDAWMQEVDPIQVSQFEIDHSVAQQMQKFHIVQQGGGNGFESADLPAYIAARRTSIDCYLKRGLKGFLFTLSDEPPPPYLNARLVKQYCGDDIGEDMSMQALADEVNKSWMWFHLVVEEGNHVQSQGLNEVLRPWQAFLGERVVVLHKIADLSELVVSIIQVQEGIDRDTVAASWGGDKAARIASSLKTVAVVQETGRGVATL